MATRPAQTRTLQELASDAAARYTAANPLSQASFERSTEFLPGADTRTVNHFAPFPATIVRGEGARLYDLDGHAYVDFLNDYTAGLYGHSNPAIQAAIVRGGEERPHARRTDPEPAGVRGTHLRALPVRRPRAVHELGDGIEPHGRQPRTRGHGPG